MAPPIISELPVIPLSVQIESPNEISTVGHLQFQVTVTNHSSETITLIRDPSGVLSSTYRTPKFMVSPADGKKGHPQFQGVKVKFSPQKAAEIGLTIVLGPGQSTRTPISQDLSRTYDFSHPGAGLYNFTPKNFFYVVDPVSREIRIVRAATVPPVSVKISGTLVLADVGETKAATETPTKVDGVEIIGGTPEQQAQVVRAVKLAEDYIDDSNRFLKGASVATPQYETWFGLFDDFLMDTVQSIYDNIKGGPVGARYDLVKCADESLYAWVSAKDQTRTINLCKLFWTAPPTGVNSQAGTIVHELTHFNDNGGTSDWAYGVVNCRLLASAARDTACNNADSFEYFAELLGFRTASGSFFSSNDGFYSSFVVPGAPRPSNFEGKFNETAADFNTADTVLIYTDVKDLTGSYTIQAGSKVFRKKININLKNESGKELTIMANLRPTIDTENEVTGSGTWS